MSSLSRAASIARETEISASSSGNGRPTMASSADSRPIRNASSSEPTSRASGHSASANFARIRLISASSGGRSPVIPTTAISDAHLRNGRSPSNTSACFNDVTRLRQPNAAEFRNFSSFTDSETSCLMISSMPPKSSVGACNSRRNRT